MGAGGADITFFSTVAGVRHTFEVIHYFENNAADEDIYFVAASACHHQHQDEDHIIFVVSKDRSFEPLYYAESLKSDYSVTSLEDNPKLLIHEILVSGSDSCDMCKEFHTSTLKGEPIYFGDFIID